MASLTSNDFLLFVGALVLLEVLAAANSELVAAVIRFVGGEVDRSARRFARYGSMVAVLVAVSLSLISVLVLPISPWALTLIGVVLAVFYVGVRRFTTATQTIIGLRLLQQFSTLLNRTSLTERPELQTVDHVRTVLRAHRAELHFLRDGSFVCRTDSEVEPAAPLLSFDHPIVMRAIRQRRTVRIVLGESPEDDRLLHELGVKDLIAAPLIRADEPLAVLMAADRVHNTSTFSVADEVLFETMASHALMTIENGRLVERLKVEVAHREHDSLHDSLTGLANRTAFNQSTEAILAEQESGLAAIMLLDINRFKEINDTLGHQAGDRTLQIVAERLGAALPAGSVLARLGGDEFAVTVPNVCDEAAIGPLARTMLDAVTQPFDLAGVQLANDVAIGIAVSPDHGTDRTLLLKRADIAMYTAKEERRSAWVLFDPSHETTSEREFALLADLRNALKRDEIAVHYQPRIDLVDGSLVGFEALARWFHPVHGPVAPDEFVPLAERSGLVFKLTDVVLRRAISDCASWRASGVNASVAVNLSARAALDRKLPGLIAALLHGASLAPTELTLEITEHELMTDAGSTRAMLAPLRAQGITLSVDDFGTGHSSLEYLTSMPIDELKIDRRFVLAMQHSKAERAIVEAIIALGSRLGAVVVAEGVEDEAAADLLRSMGCRYAQGYHFGRPMPLTSISHWHDAQKAEHAASFAPLA